MNQPLTGIKVLDFTNLLPGPLATLMLAEAGAEVIKIERAGGDEMRLVGPMWQGCSTAFSMLNRGKTALTIDLKSEVGAAQVRDFIQTSDILVEQFRPGTMDRLGFGYRAARKINPGLIYCSISGYGQSGPRSNDAGHDLNYIGNTGLLALQPGPSDRPVIPPALIADIAGGSFPAMINILLALRQRDRTGEGCHLDVAMTDAMFTFAWHALARLWTSDGLAEPGDSDFSGGSPRYQLYQTKDGALVACAALEDHFWQRFLSVLGADSSMIDDRKEPAAAKRAIATLIAAKTASEWEPIFQGADCCITVVRSLKEAASDSHFVARGLFLRKVSGADGDTIPALPVPIDPQFRDFPDSDRPAPPLAKPNELRSV